MKGTTGVANVRAAWWMIAASLAAGAVLGLWSFGGPVQPPPGFASYDDTPRRLLRLGHIAGIMLPVLNLLYVPWIHRTRLSAALREAGCRILLAGTVGLPLLLAVAAFWSPGLYLLPFPVSALLAACAIMAAGRPSLVDERSLA